MVHVLVSDVLDSINTLSECRTHQVWLCVRTENKLLCLLRVVKTYDVQGVSTHQLCLQASETITEVLKPTGQRDHIYILCVTIIMYH